MTHKKQLCVIIPVHKPELSPEEKISLIACEAKLNDFDCYLIYPEGMNVSAYTTVFSTLKLQPVVPAWLSSVEQYNKMKLNIAFYDMFSDYKYMLTYELDAFIFHADFEKINVFQYDFIGAPFFKGYLKALSGAPFIKGCNSGFSLRNIEACKQVLYSMPRFRLAWLFYKHLFSQVPKVIFHVNRLSKYKFDIYLTGKLGFFFSEDHYNEDLVWSQVVPLLYRSFKVADPQAALQFSFEHHPEKLFQLNLRQLPLGCHAWHKYRNFWNQYINS